MDIKKLGLKIEPHPDLLVNFPDNTVYRVTYELRKEGGKLFVNDLSCSLIEFDNQSQGKPYD